MVVAQVRRLCVKNLLYFFRQRVNRAARSEPHIHLILLLLRHAPDLQRLAFVLSTGNFDGFADLDFLILFLLLIEQCD